MREEGDGQTQGPNNKQTQNGGSSRCQYKARIQVIQQMDESHHQSKGLTMKTVQLNDRQLKLVTESLERMDPDTLNDDFESEGIAMTTGEELDELVRHIRASENIDQVQAAERASEEYWDNKP